MKRTLSPRQRVFIGERTTNIIGYKDSDGKVFCLTCLVKSTVTESEILYDENQPITKQVAYKENLVCESCHEPLLPEKYRQFLNRVQKAKK